MYRLTHSHGTTFGAVFSILIDFPGLLVVFYKDRRHRLQQRVFYSTDTDNRVANEACPNERAFFSHQQCTKENKGSTHTEVGKLCSTYCSTSCISMQYNIYTVQRQVWPSDGIQSPNTCSHIAGLGRNLGTCAVRNKLVQGPKYMPTVSSKEWPNRQALCESKGGKKNRWATCAYLFKGNMRGPMNEKHTLAPLKCQGRRRRKRFLCWTIGSPPALPLDPQFFTVEIDSQNGQTFQSQKSLL